MNLRSRASSARARVSRGEATLDAAQVEARICGVSDSCDATGTFRSNTLRKLSYRRDTVLLLLFIPVCMFFVLFAIYTRRRYSLQRSNSFARLIASDYASRARFASSSFHRDRRRSSRRRRLRIHRREKAITRESPTKVLMMMMIARALGLATCFSRTSRRSPSTARVFTYKRFDEFFVRKTQSISQLRSKCRGYDISCFCFRACDCLCGSLTPIFTPIFSILSNPQADCRT